MSDFRRTVRVPDGMFDKPWWSRRYGRPRRLYRWLIDEIIRTEIDPDNECLLTGPTHIEVTIIIGCDEGAA